MFGFFEFVAPKTSQLSCFFPPQSTSAAGHGIHDNTLNSPIIVKEERRKSTKTDGEIQVFSQLHGGISSPNLAQ